MSSTRSVYATLLPDYLYGQQPRIVRFNGQSFLDLRLRLLEAHLPGVAEDSFIEIKLEDGSFVCLLEDEALPQGDLHVVVHNFPKDGLFTKPAPWDRGFDARPWGPPRGPYFFDGFHPFRREGRRGHGCGGGFDRHDKKGKRHDNEPRADGWEVLNHDPEDCGRRHERRRGGRRRSRDSRSRTRSRSKGSRRSHSPRARHGKCKHKGKEHRHKGKEHRHKGCKKGWHGRHTCTPQPPIPVGPQIAVGLPPGTLPPQATGFFHGPPGARAGPPHGPPHGPPRPPFGWSPGPPPPPHGTPPPPHSGGFPSRDPYHAPHMMPAGDIAGPSNAGEESRKRRDSDLEAFLEVADGLDILGIFDGASDDSSPSSSSSSGSSTSSGSSDSKSEGHK